MKPNGVSFSNTEVAFRGRSNAALTRSRWLFKAVERPWLVKTGAPVARAALRLGLPVDALIKQTIFRQFCGGESIEECAAVIAELARYRVGTILDYSVEGLQTEAGFDATADEIVRNVVFAANNPSVPFCVFKMTGVGRFALMERIQSGATLTPAEKTEWVAVQRRVERICSEAHAKNVRVFVDAEESWIQDVIDDETRRMMARFNREHACVYGTIQMYRHDRLEFLHVETALAQRDGYHLGVKLVRGAYMEKEREWAQARGLPSPIYPDKAATDSAYDEALEFCVAHVERIGLCAGTHNEGSSLLLTRLVEKAGLAHDDPRVYSSQLLGMGDHITYNLANAGYNAAKYVPYGPVAAVFPYLVRRAEENTSIQGQTGRELNLIETELRRRRGVSP